METKKTNAEKLRAWRHANPERYRATERAWREKRREILRAQDRARKAKDPVKYQAAAKLWRAKNRERQSQRCREYRFSKRKVTVPMPDACQICGADRGVKNLYWDHNHSTGAHRGWLCNHCNLGIGQFSENPETLRAAAAYLEATAKAAADGSSAGLREYQARAQVPAHR